MSTSDPRPPTSDSDVLVRVEGVSKKFCRSLKRSLWYGVCDMASELNPFSEKKAESRVPRAEDRGPKSDLKADLGTQSSPDIRTPTSDLCPLTSDSSLRTGEFWAVKDVSFELRRGECLGLIGRNGAGKTTLLKMLNGLIKPDHGRITMRGRVGALIALGAGFNPILTGRENIYVNGSILGLSKNEIDDKIQDIIAFTEIDEFIDAPVQSYSSGMQVRLGFAVATALNPDILILDEVLAVGDAAFRAKCYRRILEIRKKAAVIFVTHSMEQISRICDFTLLLSKGTVAFAGDVSGGVQAYDSLNELGREQDPSFLFLNGPIEKFSILSISKEVQNGGQTELKIKVATNKNLDQLRIRISFYSSSNSIVAEVNDCAQRHNVILGIGENEFRIVLPCLPLRAGQYQLGINLIDQHGDIIVWSYKEHLLKVVGEMMGGNTECQIPVSIWETKELEASND